MDILFRASLLPLAMFCILGSAGAESPASYAFGEKLFRQEKFVAAEQAWTKAAAAGDLRAQHMLGVALTSGRYFPIDEKRGLAYLTAASEQGYGAATHALYDYRLRKRLGPLSETIALLEKAAAQGSVNAKSELELMSGRPGVQMGEADLDRMVPTRVTKLAAGGMAEALVRGRKVYDESCQVCHATGIVNAPRPHDRPAWTARNKQGFDVLVRHAIDGFRAHPPKGGAPSLSGDEVRDAVVYMSADPSE